MSKRKFSKSQIAAKRKAKQAKIIDNAVNGKGKLDQIHDWAKLSDKEKRLKVKARQILTTQAHPEIRNRRVGCKYAGWLRISIANRDPEWRLNHMQFFGDWCTNDMLDEILPDMAREDTTLRKFEIDLELVDIVGNEYKTEPFKIYNPKNIDDLERQIKEHCSMVANDEGYMFDLDNCYAEIRA